MTTIKKLEIYRLAKLAAKFFTNGLSREVLSGYWDAEAWSVDKVLLDLTEEESVEAWEFYHDILHATVHQRTKFITGELRRNNSCRAIGKA